MRTPRENKIDRACATVLHNCTGYLLPDATLRQEIGMLVLPPPTNHEIGDSIRYMDSNGRILGLQTETGTKWKLTDEGRAWKHEQG